MPEKCQEVSAVITESDIADEDAENCTQRDQKAEEAGSRYTMIANNYFTYQPVTLNQIDEVKSGEESKVSISQNKVISSFKDQMKGLIASAGVRKCSKCENMGPCDDH
jgi:hypothetical protein